jgi:hypothetical protein
MLANATGNVRFRGDADASLQDCYGLSAKFDTVFTPAVIRCSNFHIGRQSIVACLSSCSTLFWVLLVAAFIVTELGATAILVHVSTRSPSDRRQE